MTALLALAGSATLLPLYAAAALCVTIFALGGILAMLRGGR